MNIFFSEDDFNIQSWWLSRKTPTILLPSIDCKFSYISRRGRKMNLLLLLRHLTLNLLSFIKTLAIAFYCYCFSLEGNAFRIRPLDFRVDFSRTFNLLSLRQKFIDYWYFYLFSRGPKDSKMKPNPLTTHAIRVNLLTFRDNFHKIFLLLFFFRFYCNNFVDMSSKNESRFQDVLLWSRF